MLGLGIASVGTVIAVCMSWKSYKRVADPEECSVLQTFVKSGDSTDTPRHVRSRPQLLLEELESLKNEPERQVAAFNDVLSEVDSSTKMGWTATKHISRVAFIAGMAGGTAELASNSGLMRVAAVWAGAAFVIGVLGAATCTVIGQSAASGFRRRRQLWDEFVRWILNSQFRETALNVPGAHSNQAPGGSQRENQRS